MKEERGRILVTGGAGFIGSYFLKMIINKFDRVVCLDKLTYASDYSNIKMLEDWDNYRFVQGDIADAELVNKLFEEEHFNYVVNFAAESHVDNSITNPGLFLKTNVIGTQVLLDACVKYGIWRFHQVSTDEVYGDMPLDSKELFTEVSPIKPSSPYSASKAAADLLVLAYSRTYHIPVSISRCSNNFGEHQFDEKLIPTIVKNIVNKTPIPVYGTGKNVRDWIYVGDHCEAIYNIITDPTLKNDIYNIGDKCEKTNLQLIEEIVKILGVEEYTIKYVSDRPGHDLRYAIDNSRYVWEFGNFKNNFELNLKNTIEWYRDKFEEEQTK